MLALVLNPFTDPFPAPENIANLLWVIIALPLAGAFICGVLGRFMGRANTNFVACATVAGSFVLSCLAVWAVGGQSTQYISPASGALTTSPTPRSTPDPRSRELPSAGASPTPRASRRPP